MTYKEKTDFERRIFDEIYPIISKYRKKYKRMSWEVQRIIKDANLAWKVAGDIKKNNLK